MGACTSKPSHRESSSSQQVAQTFGTFKYSTYCKSYTASRSTGLGCKRTCAWETKASEHEVSSKIQEFWSTRQCGDPHVWEILRAAIEETDPSASASLITGSGLSMPSGVLTTVIDEAGVKYSVPVFAVNSPECYGSGLYESKQSVRKPEKTLHLTLRSALYCDLQVSLSNQSPVQELVSAFSREHQRSNSRPRLFFNGKELKPEHILANCPIVSHQVVQVFIAKE